MSKTKFKTNFAQRRSCNSCSSHGKLAQRKLASTAVLALATTGFAATTLALILGSTAAQKATAVDTTASNAPGSQISVVLPDVMALRVLDKTNTEEITSLDLELMPTPNGAFTKDSMLVEASTSNITGYKLYISTLGQDHDSAYTNALINQDSTVAASVGTIPSLASGTTPTEAAYRVSSSAYRGTWGYSTNGLTITAGATETDPPTITEVTDTTAITYNYFPVQGDTTIIKATATAVSKELTPVTIGVNATSAVSAGTYANIVEYTAVANPTATEYSVDFDANVTIEDMPTKITLSSVASSATITIPSTTPTRTGYTFIEWNTEADGTGTSYQPGDTITLTADDSDPTASQITLYAIWGEPSADDDFWNITYMQQMTNSICAAVTTPSSSAAQYDVDGSHDGDSAYIPERTLYDWRGADGTGNSSSQVTSDSSNAKSYKIRKLADGNCWMVQNLEIPLATGTKIEAAYNTTAAAYDFTPTSCSSNGACSMNANTVAGNGTRFYSWYAATAETGTSADVSVDTSASICPIGWRLPANYTISSSKSYGSLTNAYGMTSNGANNSSNYTTKLESAPFNFSRYGLYYSGSLHYSGTNGYYWSSTAYFSSTNAYSFFYDASLTYPQYGDFKYYGFNVRCVAL